MIIHQYDSSEAFLDRFNLSAVFSPELSQRVQEIIQSVIQQGDGAVLEFTARFDRVERDSIKVSSEEIAKAKQQCADQLVLFGQAAKNIREFHRREKQDQQSWEIRRDGASAGQRVTPLTRVGVYVPGGTAGYPSSVLMNVIPAQVAGVESIALVSPPDKSTGTVNRWVLAAAAFLGIDEVYAMGGAQAIAALAFGTETIEPVNKITGPGNQYVNEAKRQVFGQTGIDSLAGPSEILVIADDSAQPDLLAADLLSQAEHDVQARPILVTTSQQVMDGTLTSLEEQLITLPREAIARESLKSQGALVLVNSRDKAVDLANRIAPEHLELQVENPEEMLEGIRHAGAVFLGRWTPEPVGDYWAGSNHILPTAGAARYASALSVRDFLRYTSVIKYDGASLERDGQQVMDFARLEGLEAHARSVELRLTSKESRSE